MYNSESMSVPREGLFNFHSLTPIDFDLAKLRLDKLKQGDIFKPDSFEEISRLLKHLKINKNTSEDSPLGRATKLRQQLSQRPEDIDTNLYAEVIPEIIGEYADQLSDNDAKTWLKSLDISKGIENLKHDQDKIFMEKVVRRSIDKVGENIVESSKSNGEVVHYRMTNEARRESDLVFHAIVDRFDGDLANVKNYIHEYAEIAKSQFESGKLSYPDYKKTLTFLSSLRGKTTYNAFQNYIKVEGTKKVASDASGLKGIFGGRKNVSEKMENVFSKHGVGEVMTDWKKMKAESRKGEVNSETVWHKSREYEKSYTQLEKYWGDKTKKMDAETAKLLEEVGVNSNKINHLKHVIVDAIPIKLRQQMLFGSFALTSVLGGVQAGINMINTQREQQQMAEMTATFVKEWDQSSTKQTARQTKEPSATSTAESSTENVEIGGSTELMQKYYDEVVLPERIKQLDKMEKAEREKMFEAIGGPENIDNGLFTLVIMGKDTQGNRYGADKDGMPLGRNDQTIVVMIDVKQNKVSVVSIPRDLAIPPGLYGESTPNTFNGLTWIDQHHSTENGGYVPLDRIIAQRMITDAVGNYVDGIVEFDFESAATVVDSLFPKGIEIVMSDTFVPENEILGKISGYRKGGYNAFKEGQSYKFNGEAVVALLRSRETRLGDTYSRESDAVRVISFVMESMVKQFATINSYTELTERYNAINDLVQSTNKLEDQGDIKGYFWGSDVRPTNVFAELLGKIGLDNLWNFAKAWQLKGDQVLPQFGFYSPKVDEMVAAPWYKHKVVFSSGVDKNNQYGQERNPLKFWEYFREKVNDLVGK